MAWYFLPQAEQMAEWIASTQANSQAHADSLTHLDEYGALHTVFDKHGDLQLVVHGPINGVDVADEGSGFDIAGEDSKINAADFSVNDKIVRPNLNKRVFYVCSRALSRASPVFERMLYGYFAESKKSDTWTVVLHDDKIGSMYILLDLMHGGVFRVVDRLFEYDFTYDTVDWCRHDDDEVNDWRNDIELRVSETYELAVVTDKYQATSLFRPWIFRLVIQLNNCLSLYIKTIEEYDGDLLPKFLWIFWEIGHLDSFKSVLEAMAKWTAIDSSGALSYRNPRSKTATSWFAHAIEPGTASDLIRDERILVLSVVLGDIESNLCCHCYREICQKLYGDDQWPVDVHQFQDEPYSLLESFQTEQRTREGDRDCACRSITSGQTHMNELPQPMVNHLRAQAERSGLLVQRWDHNDDNAYNE
ncbi:hypothetical protein GGR57DRAFT_499960 [Xylariaceae sp. FL1272]|nr:hypothetical protein GGR57DRAFT_499960 [Xylariaceae sp. FL1272]